MCARRPCRVHDSQIVALDDDDAAHDDSNNSTQRYTATAHHTNTIHIHYGDTNTVEQQRLYCGHEAGSHTRNEREREREREKEREREREREREIRLDSFLFMYIMLYKIYK